MTKIFVVEKTSKAPFLARYVLILSKEEGECKVGGRDCILESALKDIVKVKVFIGV